MLPKLIGGGCTITIARAEAALEWFALNWPEGAVWPAGVHRPFEIPRTDTVSPAALPCPGSDGVAGTPASVAALSRRAAGAGETSPSGIGLPGGGKVMVPSLLLDLCQRDERGLQFVSCRAAAGLPPRLALMFLGSEDC